MAYTDSTLNTSVPVKKVHISELVSAVSTLLINSKSTYSFNTASFTYDKISEANIKLLQNAVHSLESSFSNNCCQANCCQTCQSTICQTTYCQACQGCQSCQTTTCQTCQTCQSCQACQSWTINNNCNCNCDACGSCFIAGTKVLCFSDGIQYWKNIETLAHGDVVVGANGQLNTVLALYETRLGDKRSVLTFDDNSLSFSDEHPFWVRNGSLEWFGVHNYNSYYREKVLLDSDGFTLLEREIAGMLGSKPVKLSCLDKEPFVICDDVEYATTKGFIKNSSHIDRNYGSDTILYSPLLDGSHTCFVNGYLVGSFMTNDFDYSKLHVYSLD